MNPGIDRQAEGKNTGENRHAGGEQAIRIRWTVRDTGGQRQMERQQIGSLEKGERRRAERKSAAGQETGDEASWWGADRRRKWAKGQGQGE